jgi:hypothetical protein
MGAASACREKGPDDLATALDIRGSAIAKVVAVLYNDLARKERLG